MCNKAAGLGSHHFVARRLIQLIPKLEPLLIVVMDMVVMLIVLAVLMPISPLNQLVR
jgi:type II secretory pathway component PulF